VVHRETRASTGRPRRAASGVRLATLVLLWSSSALALDPSLDVSQYAHTGWRVRDGFTRGTINAIAQTPDGYLWLGTEFGLLRFDGVRAVPWQPAGEQLPASYISTLAVTRDGTLWIGTRKGLASWRNGTLTQHPELAGSHVTSILQDGDGTLWFGTVEFEANKVAKLCAVLSAKLQCQEHKEFGWWISGVSRDHLGNLWVLASTGLWRWKPGPAEHYSFPLTVGEANDLIEDDSDTLLLATNDGLKRLAEGKIQSHSLPGVGALPRPNAFLRSSDGSLWIGTWKGLVHVHHGKTDVFGVQDGLSADFINGMFEDREGNLWVGTHGGLDRFRGYRFPSISVNEGLSNSSTFAVLATPDGSVWIGGTDGLSRWKEGNVTFHRRSIASPPSRHSVTTTSATGPAFEGVPQALAMDDGGRLWAASKRGVFSLEADRFMRVPGLPGGNVWSIAPDDHGNAWVGVGYVGLFHGTTDAGAQRVPWSRFGKAAGANVLLPDPSGGLWLGFSDGGVSHFENDRVVASYTPADGLGAGSVTHLRFGEEGIVWAATESGLSRIADGHVLTLTAKNGLPCDAVHWSIEDDDQSVWLYMPCGLLRVARSELEAWVKSPERIIHLTVFDASDGVRTVESVGGYGPRVTKAPDGRIWFTHPDGITVIDPRHLPQNDLPPPVHIEQISADDHVYDATAVPGGRLLLPRRVRDLSIDYTALSLVAPEKVHFRIKLEGQDTDWRELVNERHVRYTNLPPRDYRFLVKASNDSGVWNEEGAALDFTIPPVFYQTTWFRALCVASAAGLLWAAYRIRVGVLARHQERLLDAQEEERARIAGELHDGVLQQLTTVTVDLGTLKYQIPPGSPTKMAITGVQKKLIEIGTDIRHLSHELHSAQLHEAGLTQSLSSYCAEFSKARGIPVSCEVDSDVKELAPRAALTLYRIAQEALGNVAKHAKAKEVRVRLERVDGVVRLTVSDDGVGFVSARAGDSGGVGLANMRERVRPFNGALEIESQPGRGTTIRAEVPVRSG